MARKQSDYLAGLLSDTGAGSPPSPALRPDIVESIDSDNPGKASTSAPQRPGLSLLSRETALSRVASGDVRQVTQLLLDPDRVRIWPGNARSQAGLSEESCRDLIDSLIAEGGQKVPAVVRRITGDPEFDYELVVGTRRHFAIRWLRQNSYPEMKLLAHVAELDDEAAFRLADIENRARRDISDIERARNYAAALDRHYGGKAIRMAERLKVSKGWLSKMLKAATVPDEVLAAFADLHQLSLNPAYQLAGALEDASRANVIGDEADRIVEENRQAAGCGAPSLPGSVVLARLLAARDSPSVEPKQVHFEVAGSHGRAILSVKSVNRQGITLHLPSASGATDEQISAAVREVLEKLRSRGVSVA
ncbi:ParB/RepB/Spo0J family partition protein [Sandaracinobacteroides hominis]|uniref:ParB/RepB/Spo0J family partition protein n=1 Tax=Sandaracinobacteroides hominis TaxID=2780086 RepID=UPI0018F5AFFC|nr:ParB/RepB/Spo0J family partition protein [Sandaracinobacteroides hominis]